MSDSISLTVPRDDEKALVAASTLLLTLAGKIPPLELDDCGAPAPVTVNNADPEQQAIGDVLAIVDAVQAAGGTPEHQPPAPVTVDTPPLVTPGVEVDKNGLPWDARIHAGTKAKNADGTWKYKRGVDRETEVPAVEEELRALMAIPVAEPAPVVPAAPAPVETPVAGVPATPVPVPDAPAPTAEEAPTTFPEFLRKVTERINAGTLSMDYVNAVNAEHGIDRMASLAARPDLIPQIWNAVTNG